MKNFRELKEEFENKKNEEFKKTGIFYAFSNAQWEEQKTHKDAPDNEFVSVGCGAYIHKSNKAKLNNYFENILPQLRKDFIDKINLNDLIDYELINHECWYTGEWFEVVEILKDYNTGLSNEELTEKVREIYKAHPERFDW